MLIGYKFSHIAFFLILVSCPINSFCSAIPSIRIIDNGKPMAAIVISDDASIKVRNSVYNLRDYIKKVSQATLPVLHESQITTAENNLIRIWVGTSSYTNRLQLQLEQMDEDGFVIVFPNRYNVVIIGPTDWGTEFGVYEFLERYMGVRWLIPGPAGEHVPERETIDIPQQKVRQEPTFFSRQLSGLNGGLQATWARRNRMHARVKFHHNLAKLFPPAQYKKIHPEFFPVFKKFPLVKGKRYLPPDNEIYGWQPCFTAPEIVDEAINNICAYFETHLDATSYSLGINDSGGHCQCDQCVARDSRNTNFLGRRSLSDRYFEWANAVVEGVLKKYPDKWFGCLAYDEIAEPPSRVSVHPRIIPYLTYDRMKWVNEDIEREGKKITELWRKKASFIGWYDYIYGTPYLLPRVYFHKMANYYKYAANHNVRAMYAEAYPNWGEGPKLYIALKLQWNPDQDVDKLLQDWYIAAVGKKAYPDLAAYYSFWERFWTQRVPRDQWFTRRGQYLAFYRPEYLDSVTYRDIAASRKLLEAVVSKTQTEQQRARAELLLQAFEYYESSAVSYLGLIKKQFQPEKDSMYYEEINDRRYQLVDRFQKDPILFHYRRFDKGKEYKYLRW